MSLEGGLPYRPGHLLQSVYMKKIVPADRVKVDSAQLPITPFKNSNPHFFFLSVLFVHSVTVAFAVLHFMFNTNLSLKSLFLGVSLCRPFVSWLG